MNVGGDFISAVSIFVERLPSTCISRKEKEVNNYKILLNLQSVFRERYYLEFHLFILRLLNVKVTS